MRIVVFSDSHGSFNSVLRIFERNRNADVFIFLGDGEREVENVSCLFPDKQVIMVAGNCDYGSLLPQVKTFSFENAKAFFTHGHAYGVKSSDGLILRLARENNANIALFGHTHCRFYEYCDGVHILNPGSAALPRDGNKPSYAFIDITKAGIVCAHVDL